VSGDEWRWSWGPPVGSDRGQLAIAFPPDRSRVRVTAVLARPGEDLVVLDEPDAPWPRPGSMEIRASGLWVDAIEEEPAQRWTIGLEAFALAVDDPAATVGVRVPLGFDLEWERSGPDADGRPPARVHGEVLIRDETVDIDAEGWWDLRGGPQTRR
jgi:hypothetical protein